MTKSEIRELAKHGIGSLEELAIVAGAVKAAITMVRVSRVAAAARGAAIAEAEAAVARGVGSGTYYRYMSEAEYKAVQKTGYLRGGNTGETFFTNTNYTSASSAQSNLSLKTTSQYMVEFKITNNPNVTGGTIVQPHYGQLGGGIEFVTTDPVQVQIINAQPLR